MWQSSLQARIEMTAGERNYMKHCYNKESCLLSVASVNQSDPEPAASLSMLSLKAKVSVTSR